MSGWVMYSLIAGASYGLSSVYTKYTVSRTQLTLPTELVLTFSALGALIGAVICLGTGKMTIDTLLSTNYKMATSSIVSGLISVVGSFFVIKALSMPKSSVANVMAIVNTNVFFALLFAMIFLKEIPSGNNAVLRLIIGSVLIMIGSGFIAKA